MRKGLLTITTIVVVLFGIVFAPFFVQYSPILYQLLFHKNIDLKKADNTINILLLGVGGGTHEGPDLTDTIMFTSINQDSNKVTFVSIPRDLWVPDLKGKINSAYAKGEQKRKGGGLVLTKAVVEKIIDQPIDYVVKVDFDGFIKAIDYVGGLDIDVERAFDDLQYPIEEKREELCDHSLEEATELIATMEATIVFPCRYEHVHFDKGVQHMDGKRALIFVRSRYATGAEGTDFARSMRQQKIIKAFRDKIFSAGTLLNPVTLVNLYNTVSQSITTDIEPKEIDDFVRLGQKMKKAEIHSVVLDYGDPAENRAGLLLNPPIADFGGAWVLIPRIGLGRYTEIQQYVACVLTKDTCPIK